MAFVDDDCELVCGEVQYNLTFIGQQYITIRL